jgi:hypothetical protein
MIFGCPASTSSIVQAMPVPESFAFGRESFARSGRGQKPKFVAFILFL